MDLLIGIFIFIIIFAIIGITISSKKNSNKTPEERVKERAEFRAKEKARVEAKAEARAKFTAEEKLKEEAKEAARLDRKAKVEAVSKDLKEVQLKLESNEVSIAVSTPILAIEELSETEQSVEDIELSAEEEKKPLSEIVKGKIRKSRPVTMNEQPLFKKLKETLEPEYVVLAQVSFGAILWTRYKSIRNRFNRKIVDFVICDKGFNVIAVIELDDSSHKGQEQRDADRDTLLNEAGISVIRYKRTPEAWKIREDIKSVVSKAK